MYYEVKYAITYRLYNNVIGIKVLSPLVEHLQPSSHLKLKGRVFARSKTEFDKNLESNTPLTSPRFASLGVATPNRRQAGKLQIK